MIYNSDVEQMLMNDWELKKIFKVNEKHRTEEDKLRVYLFKKKDTDYLKDLRMIDPKKSEEIEDEERYWMYKDRDIQRYKETIRVLNKLDETVEEVEIETSVGKELKDYINIQKTNSI